MPGGTGFTDERLSAVKCQRVRIYRVRIHRIYRSKALNPQMPGGTHSALTTLIRMLKNFRVVHTSVFAREPKVLMVRNMNSCPNAPHKQKRKTS
jgi:hypothetical protein